MKLKNHIKQHRARMDFTQQDLANLTGVSRQTINTVEKGRFIPTTVLALKIAKALEMKVDELFELIEEEKTKVKKGKKATIKVRKKTREKLEKKKDKEEVIVRESFIERIQKSRFD